MPVGGGSPASAEATGWPPPSAPCVPWAGDVAAVVSVADDGGSSGRLRDDLGIVPPGDLRRCLSALADPGSVLGAALEQRFGSGDLKEHALGNLLIAGLVEHGLTIEEALAEVGRLVGARGRVIPAATVPVTLTGDPGQDVLVEGQVRVQAVEGLRRVDVHPVDAPTPRAAVEAIGAADLVVLGPGSLFTSVLAAAVVPAVAAALGSTPARRVLVLNLGPQLGETQWLGPGRQRAGRGRPRRAVRRGAGRPALRPDRRPRGRGGRARGRGRRPDRPRPGPARRRPGRPVPVGRPRPPADR